MKATLLVLALVVSAASACRPDAMIAASRDGGPAPALAVSVEAAAASSNGRATREAPASWHGVYRSEPGTLYIPPDWKGVRWNVSDTTSGLGEGSMRLTLDPAGRVEGVIEGPLGPATVVGFAADGALTASIRPERSENRGFAGTLTAHMVDGRIEGAMHVSPSLPDAVRVASFVLAADGARGP
jgi:hypothetical protein